MRQDTPRSSCKSSLWKTCRHEWQQAMGAHHAGAEYSAARRAFGERGRPRDCHFQPWQSVPGGRWAMSAQEWSFGGRNRHRHHGGLSVACMENKPRNGLCRESGCKSGLRGNVSDPRRVWHCSHRAAGAIRCGTGELVFVRGAKLACVERLSFHQPGIARGRLDIEVAKPAFLVNNSMS